ncbi:putative tetratricopeptide-like helical domain superfamily [Helianthus annuus]|uniref:Putative tetratricopeptide repeat (TPR)-like superfamily protein n=1 Tax=Helianthus annuus TaxID=4232 RepID=A0A251SX96_HELAN|nr:putative pentatricopeptide repeat-containing protein At3g23330 [Helianthus annuus]KAF5775348.1 putative tetratricopeptide-like helical domain superfamily [Helianthus annuus]
MEPLQTTIKTLINTPIQIKSKSQAKQIHAQIIKTLPTFTSNLLSIYSKLNLLQESITLFNTLHSPSIHNWKSIIKCYTSNAYFLESLNCFVKMRAMGIYPDHNVFPSVLKSCTQLMFFKFGESVHGSVIRVGLEFDVFTGNALLSMYSKSLRFSAHQVFDESPERKTVVQNGQNERVLKHDNNTNNNFKSYNEVSYNCRNPSTLNQMSNQDQGNVQMQNVRKVFETMPERDVVSYNTLILGYAQNSMYDEAMMTIREMGDAKLKPDAFTLSNVLPIVAEYMDVWKGKEIHGYGIRHGFERNGFIASGLIDVYANCKMVEDSYRLFCSLPEKDCVSWCSMIAACVQNGLFDEGLRLFRQMLRANIKPVPISFSSVIPACAHLTTLPLGQQLHGYIIRHRFDDNVFISSSLVNMYAKCGNIKLAKCVFNRMKQRDLVSWTAMIMGCASHGYAHDAIVLFKQMEMEDLRPNSVAFVAVLTACSHAGMVNDGLTFFNQMVKHYKITPEFEHYACMADLLGRAGKLDDAFGLICSMPENKTGSVWLPLLAACRVHKNVELAEKVVEQINEFDSDNVGAYVLLSNIYFSVGRYKDAANVRRMLSKNMNKKEPACSWIRIGEKVHAFIAGDESHPNYDCIINALDILFGHIEKEYLITCE